MDAHPQNGDYSCAFGVVSEHITAEPQSIEYFSLNWLAPVLILGPTIQNSSQQIPVFPNGPRMCSVCIGPLQGHRGPERCNKGQQLLGSMAPLWNSLLVYL